MARALVALDVDDCLMPVNQPPRDETRCGLRRLADLGAHICFASGKPCLYLSGLARGLSLMTASLIGENGADIWLTSTMPPEILPTPLAEEERVALARVRSAVAALFGDQVFFQPNTIGVTAFPARPELTPEDIAAGVGVELPESLARYVHADSVDWAVCRFDKGEALRRLIAHFGIPAERVAAVGDSANDLPMCDVAELFLWRGDPEAVERCDAEVFEDIASALDRLAHFVAD